MPLSQAKRYSALIAIALFLATGCCGQNTAISSFEQVGTNEGFDVAEAMQMLYGNYNAKEHTSAALLPEWGVFSE